MTPETETDSGDDEQPTENDEMVQQAVQQANQFHQMMDQAKAWSRETAADVRVEAALEEDEQAAAELGEIVAMIETVTKRIEEGDNNRARNTQR